MIQCTMFEKFSRDYYIGSAYIKRNKRLNVADVSKEQYNQIKKIYSDQITKMPLIKIPEDNKHIKIQLNPELDPNTIKYPIEDNSELDLNKKRAYLLMKPSSAIGEVLRLR